jgi:hypothetical protein
MNEDLALLGTPIAVDSAYTIRRILKKRYRPGMERWRACPDKISHATAHFTLGKQSRALVPPIQRHPHGSRLFHRATILF